MDEWGQYFQVLPPLLANKKGVRISEYSFVTTIPQWHSQIKSFLNASNKKTHANFLGALSFRNTIGGWIIL
jgi:hypothetical protein